MASIYYYDIDERASNRIDVNASGGDRWHKRNKQGTKSQTYSPIPITYNPSNKGCVVPQINERWNDASDNIILRASERTNDRASERSISLYLYTLFLSPAGVSIISNVLAATSIDLS
eukprot:scaffold81716_cov58-Attheya_sp.AAC.4